MGYPSSTSVASRGGFVGERRESMLGPDRQREAGSARNSKLFSTLELRYRRQALGSGTNFYSGRFSMFDAYGQKGGPTD